MREAINTIISDQDARDAQIELDALLAQLEAERPAFEAWMAEQTAQAQRELDELLAELAADTALDELLAELAALEAPAEVTGVSGAARQR